MNVERCMLVVFSESKDLNHIKFIILKINKFALVETFRRKIYNIDQYLHFLIFARLLSMKIFIYQLNSWK